MKRLMRRLLAGFLLVCLLTGCMGGMDTPFRTVRLPLRISVEASATSEEREGMRLLVEKLIAYSPTLLEVNLYYEEDPIVSLRSGEADLVYVSSKTMAKYDADYLIYSAPFFFRDYDHMTMTLNSPNFWEIIEDDCTEVFGARQLAAVYGGSMCIFSKEGTIRNAADLFSQVLGMGEDPYTVKVFKQLAQQIVELPSLDHNSLEIERLTAMEVNTRDLLDLADSETVDLKQAYYVPTNHRINVQWLLVDEDFYANLQEKGQAALQEAASYAVAYIDGELLRKQKEELEILQNLGVRTSRISSEALRKIGRELLLSNTDFLKQADRARYEAVSALIR